jgi:RNA polymerase sigma factor (sigma-70 family)
MPPRGLNQVLCSIRRALGAPRGGELTDRQLLEDFVRRREEAAFTTLVRRHGPMVLGVCRRVLRHEQDAEDAFQAAFLVLARKAASLAWQDSVGAWLHEVAYRLAVRMRGDARRRQAHEREAAAASRADPTAAAAWQELRQVLDEELQRLPRHYRAPLVLCYLEGRTRDEAAQQLGWTVGTVKGRLERARRLLHRRLLRRGLTLSAALVAAVLAEQAAPAAVPAALLGSAARYGLAFVTGKAAAAAIPPRVAALTEGVIRAMGMSKLKVVAASLLAVALLAGGLAVAARQALADKPKDAKPPEGDKPAAEGIPFRQVALSADDLVAVTGLNVYKYKLDLPKGARFQLLIREFADKDAAEKELWHHDFEKVEDGPATLRVSFLRLDRQLSGVLFSQEKQSEFRVECDACSPGGLATVVQTPLHAVPGPEKMLQVFPSDKERDATQPDFTRLLRVFHHDREAKPVKSLDEVYPRAEMVLIRLGKSD